MNSFDFSLKGKRFNENTDKKELTKLAMKQELNVSLKKCYARHMPD